MSTKKTFEENLQDLEAIVTKLDKVMQADGTEMEMDA